MNPEKAQKAYYIVVILAAILLLTPYFGIHLLRSSSSSPTASPPTQIQIERPAHRTPSPASDERGKSTPLSEIEDLLR